MMPELSAWPYDQLPNAYDSISGLLRYICQYTEDGYYGFAFSGKREVAVMVGPHLSVTECVKALKAAAK